MISLGTESSSLFFPLNDQRDMFNNQMVQSDDSKKILLSGVKQAAIFSQSGCYIETDPIVTWFNKDKVWLQIVFSRWLMGLYLTLCFHPFYSHCWKLDMIVNGRDDKVPIIDYRKQEIAGVRVNFERLRNDPDAQHKIEEEISKLLLDFEYVIMTPNAQREKGKCALQGT